MSIYMYIYVSTLKQEGNLRTISYIHSDFSALLIQDVHNLVLDKSLHCLVLSEHATFTALE